VVRKDEEENEVEVDADLVESDDEDPDERYLSRSRSSSASNPCSRAEASSIPSIFRSCSFSASRRCISVSRSTIQSCSSIRANRVFIGFSVLGISDGVPSALASSSLASPLALESRVLPFRPSCGSVRGGYAISGRAALWWQWDLRSPAR
jgi:hypothetical protein